MPGIKFNLLTKEIEVKGSESFIDSNLNRIQDLLIEHFGVKEKMVSRKKETNPEPLSWGNTGKSQAGAEIERHVLSEPSQMAPAAKSTDSAAKRPPLRKYIRKEGLPGQQKMVVEVAEQKTTEISIASLKEKFGLSDSKIGGIIRDAEKLGKIKRGMGGSYSWA